MRGAGAQNWNLSNFKIQLIQWLMEYFQECSMISRQYSYIKASLVPKFQNLWTFPKFPKNCQLGPRYEGQLTRMAEPIPPSGQSSSYSLTTLSSSSSTDRRAETNKKVITTRIAVAHHFICRLRRRESCILGAIVQSANITPTRTTSG